MNSSFVADLRFSSTTTGAAHPPEAAPVEPDPAQASRLAGFAEGLHQGRAEGRAEAQQDSAERRRLGIALRQLDEAMIDQLSQQLSETVAALCAATLAPIAVDPDRLSQRCRAAAVLLGEDLAACTVHLHSADIARLEPDPAASWLIVADDTLEPGSIRLFGRDGEIADGPQEWRRSLNEALGLS